MGPVGALSATETEREPEDALVVVASCVHATSNTCEISAGVSTVPVGPLATSRPRSRTWIVSQ